jgi:hypothetical protein
LLQHQVVHDLLVEAQRNRAPECELYCPTEGKFLCIRVDPDTGKHAVTRPAITRASKFFKTLPGASAPTRALSQTHELFFFFFLK